MSEEERRRRREQDVKEAVQKLEFMESLGVDPEVTPEGKFGALRQQFPQTEQDRVAMGLLREASTGPRLVLVSKTYMRCTKAIGSAG